MKQVKMASASGLASIEKLNEQNYDLWKVQMKSVLVFNDMWSVVDGSELKPQENASDWTKKDAKASALINLSISYGQLNHVKNAKTSKEAWDKLQTVFESKGPVRKAALYKKLLRMEKKDGISMTQYVSDFSYMAEQLTDTGIEIPEDLLSIMLLNSLPTEFENFSIAMESRDDIPKLENLKLKLIEEEARQSDRAVKISNIDEGNALFTKNRARSNPRKFFGKCFVCGKFGHKSQDCTTKTSQNKFDNVYECDAMTAIACNAEVARKQNTWYLDKGATRHMCNDRQMFTNIDTRQKTKVYTASDDFVESLGMGDIILKAKVGQNNNPVKLKNVLFVPDLRNNLISIPSVTENGYEVKFDKNSACVKRNDGSTVVFAPKSYQLYALDGESEHIEINVRKESAARVDEEKNDNLLRWHQRYGHLNITDLKKMENKNIVRGLNLNFPENTDTIDCEICAKCKIHVKPFKTSTNRATEVLDLIHSDICGPMRTESLGGAKYFATFIDDHSRYTETVMLKKRSDIIQAFKLFKRKAENQTGRTIKKLRTDNATEYLSNEFNCFLEEEGILRQLTVEYTPQQNGVAEHANRTLGEMARCLMLQANLPPSLWAEAINTATFLRNRSTTKCLIEITPIEVWSQQKPYVGFLRTIGSKVIALKRGKHEGKFQPKGEEYILIGYSENSKAYRLWKPGTQKNYKVSRCQIF